MKTFELYFLVVLSLCRTGLFNSSSLRVKSSSFTLQRKPLGRLSSGVLIAPYSVVLIFESLDDMKGTEQYLSVVLFLKLYKVVSIFESVDKSFSVTIQMKTTEQYFPIMLYRVNLTFKSVDEIL